MSDDSPSRGPTAAEIKAKLDRVEATTGQSGAIPRAPKEILLMPTDKERADTDHHYRFINTSDPGRVAARMQAEGYERVPESEGGRRIGESLQLFKQPREKHEERKRREAEINKSRESMHVREVEQAVEGVSRFLRDQYGINVKPSDILHRG